MLTEKYEKPSNVVEKFDGYIEPKVNNSKIYEVKSDRHKYYSIWQIDKGEIQLLIDLNNLTSCFVKLAYFGKIDGGKIKEKAIDDL